MSPGTGTVYLVGAGPGDPDLITVKGARLVASAEALVYDALVDQRIVGRARLDAELHFVGKRRDDHALEQDEINALLVELAGRFRVVVRLKGGDPFLFGRGAEELSFLAARGVPVVVVPGVTSAIAAPAYAGIPLTDRHLAGAVVIATGQRGREAEPVDWLRIGGLDATVAVLMGVERLGEIAAGLIAGGRAADTPAALVEWGTTPRQRVLTATLETIEARARADGFEPPSVLVVGQVVTLHDLLAWYHPGPGSADPRP